MMRPETPGRRVGASVVAALGLCCSLTASCGDGIVGYVYWGAGGSGGSGGSGGGTMGTGSEKNRCGDYAVCIKPEGTTVVLLWKGPVGKAPAIGPMRAMGKPYPKGFADLVKPGCPACTCGPVNPTCTLPTSMTAYDVWPCPAGQPGQPFDAASPWGGKCDNNNPILAPNNVQSLMVPPIDLVESCDPVPKAPQPGQPVWNIEAKAFGLGYKECHEPNDGYVCAPTISEPGDPPEGFQLCMMSEGDDSGRCFGEEFTEPYLVWKDVVDTRTCTSCTCTPPAAKGTCTSFLSLYQNADTLCNGPEVNKGQGISSVMSTCIPINPPNQPLGSKSATAPQYIPAPGEPSCQPGGGELQGEVTLKGPTTFCCLPSKQPYPPSNHQ